MCKKKRGRGTGEMEERYEEGRGEGKRRSGERMKEKEEVDGGKE